MDYDTGNDITLNNIILPPNVVRELQRLGRAMESYTRGELESAVIATHMDGRLIDDPNGVNFYDQLELTDAEKRKSTGIHGSVVEDEEEKKEEQKKGVAGFCKRLLESREKRMQEEQVAASN